VGSCEGPDGLPDAAGGHTAGAGAARSLVGAFARDICGATAIEYALVATLISIVVVTAVQTIGSEVRAMFEKVNF
jgi:pilus assembly protein Flp/PilA